MEYTCLPDVIVNYKRKQHGLHPFHKPDRKTSSFILMSKIFHEKKGLALIALLYIKTHTYF